MRLLRLSPALLLLFVAAGAPSRPHATVTAFTHVSVVPMDRERVLPDQTVIVVDGRIDRMGPAAQVSPPAGATIVDGRGKYLMPGVAEMHAHIPGGNASEEWVDDVLFLYVSQGVTTIRGMLGHPRHLELRSQVQAGRRLGPTIWSSGPSLNGNSIPTPEAAAQLVAEQKAAGYDFLKIHPGIRREVFDTLDAVADRVGIGYSGHVPLAVGLERALAGPYASIDHLDGYLEFLVSSPARRSESQFFGLNLATEADPARIAEAVRLTKASGVALVPTHVLMVNVVEGDPAEMAAWPEMRYLPKAMVNGWRNQGLGASPPSPATAAQFLGLRDQLLKALSDGGVPILLGSDAPQVWNVPGFSIHREMAVMSRAGLTPYQILRSGTANVAEFFGVADRSGTVAPGMVADLVLLEANPLERVANFRRQAGVMVRGRWLPAGEIAARLEAMAARR